MIEDMTIRNLSRSTQQSYLYAVAKFSRHFKCPPDRLGMEEVRAYQLHLIEQKYSWTHINQVACALRFFYGITLGQKEAFERIVSGREPERLPPVLNREEIARFLVAVPGFRNRVALATAYAAGLRVGEVVRLKVGSIDSQRMLLHIENKGRQGSLRNAFPAAARDSSDLLEAGAAEFVAVSGPRAWQPCKSRRSSVCLPHCKAACPNRQTHDDAFTSA
jgi:site-specific recombinase XerD